MNRDAQLAFCKKCTNREMNLKEGLLCGITSQKASFESTCIDFKEDPSVKIVAHETEGLELSQVIEKLSEEDLDYIKSQENLIPAVICGAIAGLIGAILWGMITVATDFQIGYMAVAIGAGVGYTIRLVGKGVSQIFGFWGGAIAFVSVVLGNIFSIMGVIANAQDISLLETMLYLDYTYLPELMSETFSPIDLLFYGIAIYEGYKFSFRVLTQEELEKIRIENSNQ
ncbi:hypothetical protein DSM03_102455 [Leeuwenhoekiella aestuarii]|uniref:Uncharacterized protein n=1 Tax=Leeuwenhoekiella aestuarii TaxID=2249426 RepID=A0A4Q0NUK1_9FLAO|nr:hypothetical protein [Leeuwenhoekiella aestuarii]RXG15315.1 hypothetical protein DSM04_103203 [Leeuwenhoekiella aestuarii]RXG17578.1 hypothetical protein DSM03_102455 [Leeuwenhoekiella aestuarii]